MITRRGFMAGMAAIGALLAIPGCKVNPQPDYPWPGHDRDLEAHMDVMSAGWFHACVSRTRWRTRFYIDGSRVSKKRFNNQTLGCLARQWT